MNEETKRLKQRDFCYWSNRNIPAGVPRVTSSCACSAFLFLSRKDLDFRPVDLSFVVVNDQPVCKVSIRELKKRNNWQLCI